MTSEFESLLASLVELLRKGKDDYYADLIDRLIASGDSQTGDFLVSNQLWGGAGSIADQSLLENESLRKELETLLIKLGRLQIEKDKVNPRTEMWVTVFEKLHNA